MPILGSLEQIIASAKGTIGIELLFVTTGTAGLFFDQDANSHKLFLTLRFGVGAA